MTSPDIAFSEKELKLMCDAEIMLTKVEIIKSLTRLFSNLEADLRLLFKTKAPQFFSSAAIRKGKISRGENYLNLPYLVLDFPRINDGESLFFFRTMFWWGNYFSFSLHVQGEWLQQISSSFMNNYSSLLNKDFFFCINSSPWEYHFLTNNYVELERLNVTQIQAHVKNQKFIKLSRKLDLNNWQYFNDYSIETFDELLSMLALK